MSSSCAFAIEDIQKDSVLSLNDCIELALKNSPVVKKFKYNYGISKSNVGVAKSAYFPKLTIGTGYNFNDNILIKPYL